MHTNGTVVPHGWIVRSLAMAMLAALAAVAGLFALQDPPPAAAHSDDDSTEEHLDIDCPDDPVGEGNSYWIDVLNEHGPQPARARSHPTAKRGDAVP